jgi:hypothetical protein
MTLVHLHLRRGEAIADARPIEGAEVYFCAKDHCPHYQGQLGLLPDAATMYCALVHYAPDRTCQPYYLEAAEHLDQARRQTWQQRLAEAEAFEKSLSSSLSSPQSSSPSPGRGEGVWERGPGGEGPGEATSSAPPSSAAPNVLPFRPPSPAPRGRAGEGATTQRRTTP